ncbi:hypothetical protein [Nocardioides pantholopis]|uniref:hypothetical protein n=1 Tax=Nocardioides pantholopis TaxID=2483798 RepID=UPI000FD8F703|nr:hypothetical protein [Nocardioides pantholopis]
MQAGILVHLSDRLWFFGDDWDFLLRRGLTSDPELSLLEPHNEHWSTVPIVLFRCLFVVFGLEHYLPYALMPIVAHVVVCVLLFVLLRRAGISEWVAVLTTLVVAFLAGGAGAENTLWDFQIGFLGACGFGLVALVAVDRERRWSLPVAAVALVLALMSAGMGLVMLAWTGLLTLLRRGLQDAVLVVAAPVVVYAAWYVGFGRHAVAGPEPEWSVAPLAAMNGLAHVWTAALSMPGAGAPMLLALLAAVLLPRHRRPLFALAAAGLGALVAAYALFGYTRSGFGEDATTAQRYLYFGIVFCAPALAAGLDVLARRLEGREWARPLGWLLVAGLVVALGAAQAVRFAEGRERLIGDLQERVIAAERLANGEEQLLQTHPEPVLNPDITVSALRDRSVRESLPEVPVSEQAMIETRGNLQVAVRPRPWGAASPRDVAWVGFDRSDAGPEPLTTCTTRDATSAGARLELRVEGEPVQVRVQAGGPELGTRLSRGEASSTLRSWPIQPGEPVYVAASAEGFTLQVLVGAGPVTLCPVD